MNDMRAGSLVFFAEVSKAGLFCAEVQDVHTFTDCKTYAPFHRSKLNRLGQIHQRILEIFREFLNSVIDK